MIKDGDSEATANILSKEMGYVDSIIAKLQQLFFNGKFVEIWLT